MDFNIYPKKAAMFVISCRGIERDESREGYAVKDDKEGFLWLKHLAAIIPKTEASAENVCFNVYLKRHSDPAKIFAHSFETEPNIVFTAKKENVRQVEPDGSVTHPGTPIENIYIDPSEVVAIVARAP